MVVTQVPVTLSVKVTVSSMVVIEYDFNIKHF